MSVDYEGMIECLSDENVSLRNAASALWDGVTDMLKQSQIDTIERLYKRELSLLLDNQEVAE